MNKAPLSSPRLQRVLRVLRDGRPHSTREIVREAEVMAVSACVAELRDHGARIECVQARLGDRMVWRYTMLRGPRGWQLDPATGHWTEARRG